VSDACDRIAIVGAPGAGKSTLARRLAANLDAHHIEVDALHFLPGWKFRPEDAVRADIANAVAAERWVACGNWAASATSFGAALPPSSGSTTRLAFVSNGC
jgi:adenylate kinase family enzyme